MADKGSRFNQFMELIGIQRVSGNEDYENPDTGNSKGRFLKNLFNRSKDNDDQSGRDFGDDYAPNDQESRNSGFRQDSSYRDYSPQPDSYRGFSHTDTRDADPDDVDNMVEFKNIRQQPAPVPSDRMQHMVIRYLRKPDDYKAIIDDLMDDKQVVLNTLDVRDTPMARSVIDMIYGAAYAIGADVCKVSPETYIIVPSNVIINEARMDEEPRHPADYASNVRNFRS